MFTVIRSAKEEPDSVPAASPRLPRSTSPWSPGQSSKASRRVPRLGRVRAAPGPYPPDLSRFRLERRKRRFLAYSFLPRSPDLSHLAVLAHPGFVGAACHPIRHHPDQAAPSFSVLLRQDGGEGLPPPLKSTAPHAPRRFLKVLHLAVRNLGGVPPPQRRDPPPHRCAGTGDSRCPPWRRLSPGAANQAAGARTTLVQPLLRASWTRSHPAGRCRRAPSSGCASLSRLFLDGHRPAEAGESRTVTRIAGRLTGLNPSLNSPGGPFPRRHNPGRTTSRLDDAGPAGRQRGSEVASAARQGAPCTCRCS